MRAKKPAAERSTAALAALGRAPRVPNSCAPCNCNVAAIAFAAQWQSALGGSDAHGAESIGRMKRVVARLRAVVIVVCAGAIALTAITAQAENRNALRQIVQEECVAHWLAQIDPAPCESVSLSDAQHEVGYAVLADIKGGAHFLLIPTRTVAGIESPQLLKPRSANYFAAAWQARDKISSLLGHSVARDDVGLAVNPARARTQDQLHIHIECLGEALYGVLHRAADRLREDWSPIELAGRPYQGLRVMGETLERANPFMLLAERMPGARAEMGAYTLLVAGAHFKDGLGFIVLTGKNVPGAEIFLDSTCAIAAREPHS